jgi:hypothetical protein
MSRWLVVMAALFCFASPLRADEMESLDLAEWLVPREGMCNGLTAYAPPWDPQVGVTQCWLWWPYVAGLKWDAADSAEGYTSFELLRMSEDALYLVEDWSDPNVGPRTFGLSWKWAKRHMHMGETITNRVVIQHRRASNCRKTWRIKQKVTQRLAARLHYALWGRFGNEVLDIIVIQSDPGGSFVEQTHYARGYGVVRWQVVNKKTGAWKHDTIMNQDRISIPAWPGSCTTEDR